MREKAFKIIISVTVAPGLVAGGAIIATSLTSNENPQPGPKPTANPAGVEIKLKNLH